MAVLGLYADYLLCHFYCVGEFCVDAGYECVGIAGLDHHHAEVVALEHLVVSLFECISVALALLCQYTGVTLAASHLAVVAQIDYLNTCEVELQLCCTLGDHLVIAEEHRLADTLLLGLDSGFDHRRVETLGEDDTLWVLARCLIKRLGH